MTKPDDAKIAKLAARVVAFLSEEVPEGSSRAIAEAADELFEDILIAKNALVDCSMDLTSMVWPKNEVRMFVEEIPKGCDIDASDEEFWQYQSQVSSFIAYVASQITSVSEVLNRRIVARERWKVESTKVDTALEEFEKFVSHPTTTALDVDAELNRILADGAARRGDGGRFREIARRKFAPLAQDLFAARFAAISSASTIEELSVERELVVGLRDEYADILTSSLRDALYIRAQQLAPGIAHRALRASFSIAPKSFAQY